MGMASWTSSHVTCEGAGWGVDVVMVWATARRGKGNSCGDGTCRGGRWEPAATRRYVATDHQPSAPDSESGLDGGQA